MRPAALLSVAAVLAALAACEPPPVPAAPCPVASASAPAPCEKRVAAAYVPLPALSVSAALPEPLALPDRPERAGEAYTVWGLKKALRAPGGEGKLRDVDVTVEGYVVGTNFEDAPPCALHRTGKADPPGCVAPVPAFSLADGLEDAHFHLKVMGFASNWANVFTASNRASHKQPYLDGQWGRAVPDPLPAKGARMRVTGRVSRVFTMSEGGVESDPGGILTYQEATYLAPPPAKATLGQKKGAKGR